MGQVSSYQKKDNGFYSVRYSNQAHDDLEKDFYLLRNAPGLSLINKEDENIGFRERTYQDSYGSKENEAFVKMMYYLGNADDDEKKAVVKLIMSGNDAALDDLLGNLIIPSDFCLNGRMDPIPEKLKKYTCTSDEESDGQTMKGNVDLSKIEISDTDKDKDKLAKGAGGFVAALAGGAVFMISVYICGIILTLLSSITVVWLITK